MRAPLILLLLVYLVACANPVGNSTPASVWTQFQRGLPTHATILTLASDPHNPQTIFTGVYGTTGAYISNDQARTWHSASDGLERAPVFDLRFIGDSVYAGTAAGLYRWQNARWERVDNVPAVAVYAITRGADGTSYVATDARGIFASGDLQSWSRIPGLDGEILLNVVALDPQTLIVGASGHGAFITRDRGGTWHALEQFRDEYVTLVTIDPHNANIYLRTRSGLYRSRDAGTTWETIRGGIEKQIVNALVFDPFSERVYAGTGGGIFVTADDGASWQPLSSPTNAPILALTHPDAQTWLAGTPQGIYRSRDAGQTWESANDGLGTPRLHALAQNPQTGTLFVASEDGLYRAPSTADASFTRIDDNRLNAPILSIALAPNDPSTIYVGTYRRGIFISRDDGATWDAAGDLFRGRLSPTGLATSAESIFARVLFERIYKSDDKGETWRAVWTGMPDDAEVETMSIAPSEASQMYAGTNNGLYYSHNAGESWAWRGFEQLTVFAIWIDSHNPQALLVGATDGLYRSEDAGKTWTRSALDYSVTAIVQNDAGKFYAGTKYAGVWMSRDGARTWERLTGLDDASVIALRADDARDMLYAVTTQGLYRTMLK